MGGLRRSTSVMSTRAVWWAIGIPACLLLVSCSDGSSQEAAVDPVPQVTVTVTEEPAPVVEAETTSEEPEPTIELSVPEADFSTEEEPAQTTTPPPSEAELGQLLLTPEDLQRAGDFPKGSFGAQVQTFPGIQSYATFTTVQPAECADFVQGPFAGTVSDPNGPIVGAASVFLIEGEPASTPGKPITVIQTLQVFESAGAAAQAFSAIAESAPNCRSNSYDDGGGVIERSWLDIFTTLSGGSAAYENTVVMFDNSTLRAIGLVDDRIWGLSLVSSRALEEQEIDRFEDLMLLSKAAVQGGLG